MTKDECIACKGSGEIPVRPNYGRGWKWVKTKEGNWGWSGGIGDWGDITDEDEETEEASNPTAEDIYYNDFPEFEVETCPYCNGSGIKPVGF